MPFPSFRFVLFLVLATALLLAPLIAEAAPPARMTLNRAVVLADYGGSKIHVVDAAGEILWQYDVPHPQDIWVLPGGNLLFSYLHGAREVTRDKVTVWEYTVPESSEVHACQPLPGGNVLVAESGPMRLLEVDRAGKVVKTIPLQSRQTHPHRQMRGARKLSNGHYLVGQYFEGLLREYDENGKIVRDIEQPQIYVGVPLPGGGILCSCGDAHKVIEMDGQGKTVWEVGENDLPGNPLRFAAGIYRLNNGNTILCNWGGHGHVGEQPQVVEITRDKRVVGEIFDFTRFGTISGVCVLDENGDPAKGEIIR